MKQQDPFDYWRRVGLHVNPLRSFAWFFGINLPIVIMLGAFMHWHNGIAGEPSPLRLLMLMAIAVVAFSAGMIVMWYKVFKPAIQAEREAAGPKEQDKRT
jgi:CBS domain containing-hemolysin-like protein